MTFADMYDMTHELLTQAVQDIGLTPSAVHPGESQLPQILPSITYYIALADASEADEDSVMSMGVVEVFCHAPATDSLKATRIACVQMAEGIRRSIAAAFDRLDIDVSISHARFDGDYPGFSTSTISFSLPYTPQ